MWNTSLLVLVHSLYIYSQGPIFKDLYIWYLCWYEMQQNLKKLTNLSFVYWSFAWCILKNKNTNGWRDKQDVPKYVKRNLYKSWFSQTSTLSIVHIYFENIIYWGFYQYFMYIWLLTCILFALDNNYRVFFLNSSEVTWSKWTSLCSKISGSEEFNYSITTRHWGQGEMFGDKTVLKTGRKCLLKHAVLYK